MLVRIYMQEVFLVILVAAIVFFSIWLSRISNDLRTSLGDIGDTGDDLEEIKEGLELVATILNKLPDLLPQFHMNTNPLQPLFEAFAKKISGENPLMTYGAGRDSEGRFDGTPKENEDTP